MSIVEHVEEVEVTSEQKKQIEQYEPASSRLTLKASVPEEVETERELEKFVSDLQGEANRLVRDDILEKYDSYVENGEE